MGWTTREALLKVRSLAASKTTAGLSEAREEFLTLYNGVAKRLIQGVLIELGRKDEYELFFKDLLVNESGSTKKPAAEAPPGKGATSGNDTGAPAP